MPLSDYLDLKALSKDELDQLSLDLGEVPEPDAKDVLRGLSTPDLSKATDVGYFTKAAAKHIAFSARLARGENPLETGDYDLWAWQRRVTEGPGLFSTFIDAAKHVASGVLEAGSELIARTATTAGEITDIADRAAVAGRKGETVELNEADFRETRKAVDTAVTSGATTARNMVVLSRGPGIAFSKTTTALAKLFVNDPEQREILDETYRRKLFEVQRKNYADAKTAETFHKDVVAALPALAGIVGTTEVNALATEGLADIFDPTNFSGAFAARAVARRGMTSIFAGELRHAAEKMAERREALAGLEALHETTAARVARGDWNLVPEVRQIEQQVSTARAELTTAETALKSVQDRAQQEIENLTKAAASRVAAGRALGAVGRATEAVGGFTEKLQALPRGIAERIAPESEDLQKLVARGITSATGAGIGYAVGGTEGAAIGAAGGVGIAANRVISTAGRDMRRIGQLYAVGEQVLPFPRAVRQAQDISNFTRQAFSFVDSSVLLDSARFARGVTRGAVAGAVAGGAVGAVADPDDPLRGAAAGAGGASFFGATVGAFGQWQSSASPLQIMRERASQLRSYRDVVAARPDEAAVFNRLPAVEQERIANYLVVHPNLRVRYIDDPMAPPGRADKANPDVITINLASKDPLSEVIAHEISHHIEHAELGSAIERQFLGDIRAGIPGDFTARDNRGLPIIRFDAEGQPSFKLNDEFEAHRQRYVDAVRNMGAARGWTQEQIETAVARVSEPGYIAREIFAEAHAGYLESPEYRRDLKGIQSPADFVDNIAFLKQALGRLGFVFDRDGGAVKSSLFGTVKTSPAAQRLLRHYYRKRAEGISRDPELTGETTVIDETALTRKTGYVDRYFDASGDIVRDADGLPVYDAEGRAKLRAQREVTADVKAVAEAAVAAVERAEAAKDTAPIDPNAVQKRTTDGQTVYAGRYFSDDVVDAIVKTGRLNPVQVDNLRQINAELKAGPGREWLSFYQAASRKGSGTRYRSLAGRWRTDLVYGIQVTKGGNIVFRSVSLEDLTRNVERAIARKEAALWNNDLGTLLRDVRTYLENVSNSRPGDTGIGVEKRDFINNLTGIRVKKAGDANPLWEVTNPPKTTITSLRLDRMNRVMPLAERNVPFTADAYRRVSNNLRPDVPEEIKAGILGSPNIEDLNYEQAKAALDSDRQAAFKAKARELAPDAKVVDVVGDWADGAENSVGVFWDKPVDLTETRRIAAELGLFGNQKAMLHFVLDPEGPDALHQITFPGAKMDAARQALIDVGLDFRSVSQTKDGTVAFVFDQGQQLADKFNQLASHGIDYSIELYRARGEFLGSWDSRAAGRAEFRRLLRKDEGGARRPDQNRDVDQGGDSAGGSAVEGGQLRPDSPEFKRWFGDSKVVDGDGKPLVVYKAMYPYDWRTEGDSLVSVIDRPSEFPAFNKGEAGVKIAGFFGGKEVANRFAQGAGDGQAIFPVYLSLQAPFVIDAVGKRAGDVQFGEGGRPFREAIRSGEYDSVIIKNTSDEGTIYVALKPEQIKSATGNRGTWDPESPDIRYRPDTPEFRSWFGDSKVTTPEGKPLVVYRGTTADFTAFDPATKGSATRADSAMFGFFFTSDAEVAANYSTHLESRTLRELREKVDRMELEARRTGEWGVYDNAVHEYEAAALAESRSGVTSGAAVLPVYLRMEKPFTLDLRGASWQEDAFVEALWKARRRQADGAILKNVADDPVDQGRKTTVYVVFDPTQIKSATGNRGSFERADPDITRE